MEGAAGVGAEPLWLGGCLVVEQPDAPVLGGGKGREGDEAEDQENTGHGVWFQSSLSLSLSEVTIG